MATDTQDKSVKLSKLAEGEVDRRDIRDRATRALTKFSNGEDFRPLVGKGDRGGERGGEAKVMEFRGIGFDSAPGASGIRGEVVAQSNKCAGVVNKGEGRGNFRGRIRTFRARAAKGGGAFPE